MKPCSSLPSNLFDVLLQVILWGLAGAGFLAVAEDARREHPLRKRLLELIRQKPGVRLSTLWKTTHANRGTAQYHLLMLERAQAVEASRERKNLTRYFPAGTDPAELVLLSLLRRGRVMEVVREIQRRPGITQHELTERLLISRKVFRTYANLLIQEEPLREIREANVKRYFPTPRLSETLERVERGRGLTESGDQAKGGQP